MASCRAASPVTPNVSKSDPGETPYPSKQFRRIDDLASPEGTSARRQEEEMTPDQSLEATEDATFKLLEDSGRRYCKKY